MNAARFDRLSRALGSRSSRRNLGVGGLLGGLSVAFGSRSGFAQDETRTCDLSLVATVLVGPNEGATYQGALTLPIAVAGAIDAGTFVPPGGSPVGVAGVATDRSIRLRIDLGESGVLALSGVARRIVTGCRGEMNGIFGGPQMGDLGTWSMTRQSSANSSGATGTTGAGEGGDAEATRTPCPPIECGQTFVLDPDTCDCGCAGSSERCGEQCCPGGSMCDAPNQSCQCLAGMEICEDICAFPCPKGQVRDVNSCNCVQPGCPSGQLLCNGDCVDSMMDESNCGRCGTVCTAGSQCQGGVCSSCLALEIECTRDAQCCSGYCTFAGFVYNVCQVCQGTVCGEHECVVDFNSNREHCGSCGKVCPGNMPCIGGTCQCPFGYVICSTGCVDTLTDVSNCGSCENVCPGSVCIDGSCY